MRIIAGQHKGRIIHAPSGLPVRPTTDRAKEALFNILHHQIDFTEVKALDLFCGTGNISYELASRGCNDITCVEQNFRCCKFIRETAQKLNLPVTVIQKDAFAFIRQSSHKYDLIFADPPYDLKKANDIPDLVFNNDLLIDDGLLVVEHGSDKDFSAVGHFEEVRKYGKVLFSFFRKR